MNIFFPSICKNPYYNKEDEFELDSRFKEFIASLRLYKKIVYNDTNGELRYGVIIGINETHIVIRLEISKIIYRIDYVKWWNAREVYMNS
jgi:hypothetical protein